MLEIRSFQFEKKGQEIETPPTRFGQNCARIAPVKVKFFQTETNETKNRIKKANNLSG
jgi:hypothetical protein